VNGKPGSRTVFNPLGLLILTAIAAPWYAYAYALHGQDFIDGFIMRHNVQRFSGSLEGHGGSAFYYLIAVPLLLLPGAACSSTPWQGPQRCA
jgi:4-amino-4-deoxy-L-arabinose transferase-like glycosyltransferase